MTPMAAIDAVIVVIMLSAALAAVFQRGMVSAVILVGAVSLVASYLFLRMAAPDVAMTEAAIGAGLSTIIFLIAIRRTEKVEE